jgi:amino acid adenylation domain-containing protein
MKTIVPGIEINQNILSRAYWRKRMSDFKPAPFLNFFQHSSPSTRDIGDPVFRMECPGDIAAALDRVASSDTARQVLTLAAFGIFIYRYDGLDDMVIYCESSELIPGQISSILPLRLNGFSGSTFAGFVRDLRNHLLEDFKHGDVPVDSILNTGRANNDESIKVLFSAGDGSGSVIPEGSDYDLVINFSGREKIHLDIRYNVKYFNENGVRRLAAGFCHLLELLLASSNQDIDSLELVSPEEKSQLLSCNDHSASYPEDATLVSLFMDQALRNPDRVALRHEGEEMSYGELDRLSTVLGHHLSEKGVCSDTVVGLLTDRSMWTIIGMLSILKAGGAYLPIDIDYPYDRKVYLLENSGSGLVLMTRDLSFEAAGVDCVFIEDAYTLNEGFEVQASVSACRPSDLCYIIYTSGTTGLPKGVMIEHRNVVRLFFNDKFQFDFNEDDTWTMFHSQSFDFSVWEIYGALLFGGKLVIVPKMISRDSESFCDLLESEGVSVLNQTPSAFYSLIQNGDLYRRSLPHLRYVIFGGEALSPGKLGEWKHHHPGVNLINMYGITETTVHVTYKEIGGYEIANNISNIGRPIPTLSVLVLDKQQRLLPAGVTGEMYVGGFGVARGYINNAALSSERFISDPYEAGGRLYRTGDLARWLADGNLEYMGRMDEQVKIRGYRIELGEIEAQLCGCPGIRACAVAVHKRDDDKFLTGYYIADQELEISVIKSYLRTRLPDYMIPPYMIRMDTLALTSNGKLDRRRLPVPEINAGIHYEVPANDREELIVSVWSEILNIPRDKISVNDSFFDLGGHSLLIITLQLKLREAFDAEVTIADLFKYQTVRSLSDYLSAIPVIFMDSPLNMNLPEGYPEILITSPGDEPVNHN